MSLLGSIVMLERCVLITLSVINYQSFDFFGCIVFLTHLDIYYVQAHRKIYISRKNKTTTNLERNGNLHRSGIKKWWVTLLGQVHYYNASPRRIFDQVVGREERERTRQLFCEITTSQAKIQDYETTFPQFVRVVVSCHATHNIFLYKQIMKLYIYYETVYKQTRCLYYYYTVLK